MPSGLLRCGVRGRPYTGQGAKSSQFAYYVCGTLHREGAGACEARYLNAPSSPSEKHGWRVLGGMMSPVQ